MNTFSALFLKTFCIGVLSTASILSWVPQSLAQSGPLLTETNFDAPPVDEKDVDGRIGGTRTGNDNDEKIAGTRKDGSCTYAAMMPSHHYSSTVQAHPTFWVYVKPHLEPRQTQLFVQANLYLYSTAETDGDRQTVAEIDLPDEILSPDELAAEPSPFVVSVEENLSQPGLISLEVPQDRRGLNLDEIYYWLIEVECGESYDTLVLNSTLNNSESGTIRRVEGETQMDNSMDSLRYYSEQKTWIDTVDVLAHLTQSVPDTMTALPKIDQVFLQEWETLLSDVESKL